MTRAIEVVFNRGIYLPEADLWLDPHHGVERAFISHAHSDHVAQHDLSLCSATTRDIMRVRYSVKGSQSFRALPMQEEVEWEGWRVKLLPAGHIVGSAMLHLTRISDGATLLYTGDYKLRQGLSSERCQLSPADTLIMETTFGLPHFNFPPTAQTVAEVLKFVRETIEEGSIPVLLGYSLGKAQEILCALADTPYPVMLHKSVWGMTEALAPLLGKLPVYRLFDAASARGHVLLFPPSNGRSLALKKLKVCRTAMLTGWALTPGAKYRYQVDEVFPLSDHADYGELIETVGQTQPKRVYLVHGYTQEFAADLRARGYDAWALDIADQMELFRIEGAATITPSPSETPTPSRGGPDSFARWAEACARTAAESSRLKKTEILANYLRDLDDASLATASRFCSGDTSDGTPGTSPLNTGWAIIKRALQEISSLSEPDIRAISRTQADSGRTAFLLLSHSSLHGGFPTLGDISKLLKTLRGADGQTHRVARLKEQLRSGDAHSGAWLVRLMTGELRMGSKEGLIEEAIASAFEQSADSVREAAMLTGDIGYTALLARQNRLHEAAPNVFVPIRVMLASPEESGADIWTRVTEQFHAEQVWLEDKFDGVRAQLHRDHRRVEIFTRDLKPIASQFPEISSAAASLNEDVIFDGEIIAYSANKKLSFFDLQKRLGRRDQADLFLPSEITVRYVVFDVLWLNGTSLLGRPLHERRRMLEQIALPAEMALIEVQHARSAVEIEAAFLAARRRDNEGLIIKDATSRYAPGRRGKSWLKLKKAFATLDVVVVKAEQGHGKRSHVLSDYTFAVRDAAGAHRVIGKAYSGLTDAEIEELTDHFTQSTISETGRVRTVLPDTVLEIAFDSIQASDRHDSGLSLRFPRIKAIRRDKAPVEIDTLAYARQLAGLPA